MNANTQKPQSGFFASMIKYIKDVSYNAMKSGIAMPIAGATGGAFTHSRLEQLNASRSQKVMRKERGRQPQHVGQRRIDRQAERSLKHKNSFQNNLDSKGQVIKN